jgi:hypothetical protein
MIILSCVEWKDRLIIYQEGDEGRDYGLFQLTVPAFPYNGRLILLNLSMELCPNRGSK